MVTPPKHSDGNPSARAQVVLVVDDEPDIRVTLEMLLSYEGYEVWTAKHGKEALARLDEEASRGRRASLVLSDLKMPVLDGMELLELLLQRREAPPVVMISGHADVATAVDAVKRGAADFLEKPLDQNRVLVSVRGALARGRLSAENRSLKKELGERYEAVGQSALWRRTLDQLERAAAVDAPVLITGENGTGKEVLARNLHLLSPRANGPFVAVNCAAIPAELIESELFGHEKGSFTGAHERRIGHFEAASGGTLFLDEVGDTPLSAQAKLLRALETREIVRVGGHQTQAVDIRVVSATNLDLKRAVEDKQFRMDLFYRLNVVPLRVPSLRERPEDIPLLAAHFLERIARRQGRSPLVLDEAAAAFLSSLPFPGNVRQLKNLLEAAFVFAGDSDVLQRADLESLLENGPALSAPPSAARLGQDDPFASSNFEDFKNASEALYFKLKLEENGGNVKRTAERLGMQRSHLYKKLDRYGLKNRED
jgi:DNA-binding NtrC family response regulator